MTDQTADLHTRRPSVYLDQWVWIRLAKVVAGRPADTGDEAVLTAVRQAADAGVAFPLAATHYFETLAITDPRQRNDLAAVMGPLSRFLNLPRSLSLVRNQMLTALHVQYGRPTFRPARPTVLDLGVGWAMAGTRVPLKIMYDDPTPRDATDDDVPDLSVKLRSLGQLGETRIIAGPSDEEIPQLREIGYQPEVVEGVTRSRLAREQQFADYLAKQRISRSELRAWVMCRELIHEYYDLLVELLNEYRLDPYRMFKSDDIERGSMRQDIMRLCDAVPTMCVAADMKMEIFRNPQRRWTVNMMHDIDALSLAIPYCHIVVPDRDAADLLTRSNAHTRYGTHVTSRLRDLPAALAELDISDGLQNLSGWDEVGPPAPFCSRDSDITWHTTQP